MTSVSYTPFTLNEPRCGGLPVPHLAPSVAIITRTKDRPLLLIRALASITNQTFENWHLYIVNDGGAQDIVNETIQQYLRIYPEQITVIHNPTSLGMESAANAGLSRIKQNYFVIHDDDDSWHPKFLENTIDFLEIKTNGHFNAVVTNITVIHEEIRGSSVVETRREAWGWLRDRIDIADILTENSYPPIAMLVRSSVLKELKGFDADLPVLGDWDFNIRLIAHGNIGRIKKTLAYYHHRSSASNAYGNSVHAGGNLHDEFRVQFRNELVRRALKTSPDMIGILMVLISKLNHIERTLNESVKADLFNKLQHMHWDVNNGKQSEMLEKLQHIHWDISNSISSKISEMIQAVLSISANNNFSPNNRAAATNPATPEDSFSKYGKIADIAELFLYDHSDFVQLAYLAILGREADAQGLRYYLGRLGMGHSKASVIDQLARSREAKNIGHINGLKDLMRSEARSRSLFKRIFG